MFVVMIVVVMIVVVMVRQCFDFDLVVVKMVVPPGCSVFLLLSKLEGGNNGDE